MALNRLGLGFDFYGRDFVSHTMGNIRRQFGLMDKGSKKLAKTVGAGFVALTAGALTTSVALGTLGGAINLANQAGAFEQSLAAVGAITRATAKDMQVLEKSAINAGIATQFSPTEAVEGLRSLGTMGFNAAEATKALVPALDLAAGGQISVGQAAQTTASALRVFALDAEDAAITTDKLLRISNATALQAADLQLALGTVGRGAVIAKQSIDEMLPSIGLVKNTGVDASVAASSVSSALIFMAKNADKFKKIGVDVVDPVTGSFRPFLSIVKETGDALGNKFTKDSDRAAKAQKLFGRFGIAAYAAITNQLNKGIKDSTGKIVKNTDAIRHLRMEMKNAAGAAAEFREKLLETFEGQKTLLRGTLETMAVVFGKPFAAVFKPFVGALTDALNAVIRFFTSLPKPVQKAIAGIIVGVALLTAALGILLTVGGAITLLLPFLATFILVMKAMLIAVGAVVLVVAGLAAGFALAVWLIRNNIGGLGDTFNSAINKIKLFWKGLTDLVSKGGFSEEVSKELGKAENKGVRTFAIRFFQIFYRVKRFFGGIMVGFKAAIKFFEPAFKQLSDAFSALGDALSELGLNFLSTANTSSSIFAGFGATLGAILGGIVSGIVSVIAFFVRLSAIAVVIAAKVASAVRWIWDGLKLVAGFIWESIGPAVKWFADEWVTGFQIIGEWVGKALNWFLGLKTGFDVICDALQPIIKAFKELWSIVSKFIGSALGSWLNLGESNVPTQNFRGFRPPPGKAQAVSPAHLKPAGAPQNLALEQTRSGQLFAASLLATQAAGGASSQDAINKLAEAIEKRPTVVALNIDGARVGEAVASAKRSKLARQGVPVGEEAV